MHRRGVMDSLRNVIDFASSVCRGNPTVESRIESIGVGNESLQCVDVFCYVRDMISAEGGVEADCIGRVRSGWEKF